MIYLFINVSFSIIHYLEITTPANLILGQLTVYPFERSVTGYSVT